MLRLDGKIGDDAINSLKTFMNGSAAIPVFSGVDLTKGLSSPAAQQIMACCRAIQMQPLTASDPQTPARWTAIVNALGQAMCLLDTPPNHLEPPADLLMALSGGLIGNLRGILALVMIDALSHREERGVEEITADSIEAVGRIGLA